MRKVGASGGSKVHQQGATEGTSSASSSSKAKQPARETLATEPSAKPLTKEEQSRRKLEKGMSGVMKKAVYGGSTKTSKASDKQAPLVGSAQPTTAVSTSSSTPAMTPVKVNVLAHTPNEMNLGKVPDSVDGRLKFFDDMCAKANAGIPATPLSPGEKQMNLMVAPEWLFAKHGTKAYTPAECQRITEGLLNMSKKYPNMLIVGGSISWEMPDGKGPGGEPKFTMFNTSPVVQDGKMVHMYHKRVEGGETSVPADQKGTVSKNWGMGDPKLRSKIEHDNPNIASNSSIFTHNGMTFSMEICADSASGASLKEYAQKHPTGKGTDMHILISVGSPFQPVKTPVKNGGIMVHVDGKYSEKLPKSGVATVGTITRPDLAIKDWIDLKEARPWEPGVMPKAAQVSSTSVQNPGATGPDPEHEQVHLFSNMTVMVPKKD